MPVGGRAATLAVALAFAVLGAVPAVADPDTPTPPPPAEDHGTAGPAPGPASAGSAAPLPGPLAMDHDGTFTVGTQIMPGVYTSAGPLPGDACYWRRIGPNNVTVENALSKQPQTVTIDATDVAFKTNGCQPWQLNPGAPPPGQNPPWLSQLQLRHELDILNGLAGQSGNGQLPPY